jgi:hypothetical protein
MSYGEHTIPVSLEFLGSLRSFLDDALRKKWSQSMTSLEAIDAEIWSRQAEHLHSELHETIFNGIKVLRGEAEAK